MILGQQEANKVLPLVVNLEAYEAFLALIEVYHKNAYTQLLMTDNLQELGKLKLLDELKELKARLRDSGRSIV